ncbi:AKT-interacting protein homolog B-like [Oppia nitens]|uniref:AKT-interacting protein homolog B-like n=1 Tax=Oppia nitens TaxID=1686743 RepID=UPI0023DAAAF5|nr:AKT-interacting protein homolog B-like [Oppia nitens]
MDDTVNNHFSQDINHLSHNNDNHILDIYSDVFIEYELMREFLLYRKQNISHIYLVPANSSPFVWFGVMFVHKGIYRGLVLRFEVVIPNTYPNCQIPKIIFETIPFHPLIDAISGELNTSLKFTDWKSSVNNIWQIIDYAKQVFISMDFMQSLEDNTLSSSDLFNKKAIDLYKKDNKEFHIKVTQTIHESNELINKCNTNDTNAIIFGPFNDDIHQELHKKLLSGIDVIEENLIADPTHPSVTGLSWVQRDY